MLHHNRMPWTAAELKKKKKNSLLIMSTLWVLFCVDDNLSSKGKDGNELWLLLFWTEMKKCWNNCEMWRYVKWLGSQSNFQLQRGNHEQAGGEAGRRIQEHSERLCPRTVEDGWRPGRGWMGGKMEELMGDITAAEQSCGLPSRLRSVCLCGVWGRLRAALRASCSYSWLHYSTH